MQYDGYIPEGLKVSVPNCGIVAVAIATKRTIAEVTERASKSFNLPASWRGITTGFQRDHLMFQFGYELKPSVICNVWLQTVVKRLNPEVMYMIRTGGSRRGHVMIVHKGFVIDQGGPKPVETHWNRRGRVTSVHIVKSMHTDSI